jgi:uncharacterized protein (TIGR02271 family)
MAAREQDTVVGVFNDTGDAHKAMQALKDAGFTEDQIGIIRAKGDKVTHGTTADDDDTGEKAGGGALAGAATGAGVGALWGLGILSGILPGIGPAIAGGTLGVLLSSAAAGATAAGLAGALIGMGLSREEAEYYEGEAKAGRTIVTIKGSGRRDEALRILRQYGAYDISNRDIVRDTAQQKQDAASHTGTATMSGNRAMAGDRAMAGTTVRAHEERLRVEKTPVETGEVRVRKEVHTEHKTLDVPITREEVVIERRPASEKEVSASELQAGKEVRIPVREEEVNVEKQTVAAEDVSVGKRRVQDSKHVDETLRKEEIKIDTKGDAKLRDRRP